MSSKPNWVLTTVAWELRVDIWMRMAVGDADSRIGQWLDQENASHHHHLDRDTIRKVRQELARIPDRLAKTLSGEVLEYREELRRSSSEEAVEAPVTAITTEDHFRKAEAAQIVHIERIQAKARFYTDRLLNLPLTHRDAGTEQLEGFVSAAASLGALQVELLGDSAWPMCPTIMGQDTSSLIDDHARALVDIVPDLALALEDEPGTKVDELVRGRILKAYWDTVQALWGINSNLDPDEDEWPWGPPRCRWCEPLV